jgi:hypothetical protein
MTETIATVSITDPIVNPHQRKLFLAAGRIWLFYCNGTNFVFKSRKVLETTWSAETVLLSGYSDASQVGLFYDGNYIYITYAPLTANTPLYFRRGTFNNDGTITWSAEQTVVAANPNYVYTQPTVCADSEGYPYIGYTVGIYPYVTKSAKNDGTWNTAVGFPYQLSTTASAYWRVLVHPLTGGKVAILYAYSSARILCRIWTGTMGSEETATSSNIQVGHYLDIINIGDDIYLAFLKESAYDIISVKRTWGVGWGSEETIQTGTSNGSAPKLSFDNETNEIYCFWILSDSIYYSKRTEAGWGTPVQWITDAPITNAYDIQTFWRIMGRRIGVAHIRTTDSTYAIRLDIIELFVDYHTSWQGGLNWVQQRNAFYAQGRYWLFYCDGTYLCYKTSTDGGKTWSAKTTIRPATFMGEVSIAFDGTYMHYAYCGMDTNLPILYRRGLPNADGTITWDDEQTVVPADANIVYYDHLIKIDSSGYPWIIFHQYNVTAAVYNPLVTKSSTKNGTWTTQSGFPYILNTENSTVHIGTELAKMTGGKMCAMWAVDHQPFKARIWDGSSWGSIETVSTSTLQGEVYLCACSVGDVVHLLFVRDTDYYIIHCKRDGTWSETIVETEEVSGSTGVSATIDATTGAMTLIWINNHRVLVRTYTGTWGGRIVIRDESFDKISNWFDIGSALEVVQTNIVIFTYCVSSGAGNVPLNIVCLLFRTGIISVPETVSVSDTLICNKPVTVYDSSILSDISLVSGLRVLVYDAITLYEQAFVGVGVPDFISLSDSIKVSKSILVTDTTILTDIAYALKYALITETFHLTDVALSYKQLRIPETISLTETVQVIPAIILKIVADSISLAETILRPSRITPILDSITLSELTLMKKTLKIPDTIYLAESIPLPPPPPPPPLPIQVRPIIPAERVKKLTAKFKPEIVGTKLTDVQEIAIQRAERGISAQRSITIAIATYLDSKGITGGQRANYIAFAEALWKHIHRQKGTAAQKIANGLIAYYASTYGLNTTYLQEIAQTILGTA